MFRRILGVAQWNMGMERETMKPLPPKKLIKIYTDAQFEHIDGMMRDVHEEHRNQILKWGIQSHPIMDWMDFLTEEVGELAQAIAEHKYRSGSRKNVYKEAIQVVTLALKIAEMAEYRHYKTMELVDHGKKVEKKARTEETGEDRRGEEDSEPIN